MTRLKITKGLIIAEPWVDYILDGSKTWEMRSRQTTRRGWIGLIRKGTGAVQGVVQLIDVGHPLSQSEMLATTDKHRIPEDMIRSGAVERWNTPWKLSDVRRLKSPVPYRHRNGAVTWARLDPEVSAAIQAQLGEPARPESSDSGVPAAPNSIGVKSMLVGEAELSAGNIANNHIYLRSFFDRFPRDSVGGSNRHDKAEREITIDWGGAYPVRTDLDGSKRIFRARGWIRPFFEENNAEPGDWVVVEETGPYEFRVRFRKAGA